MAQQTINVGTAPNDGTGTPLRTAFQYTNSNFSELYTALGGGSGLPGSSSQIIFNDGSSLAGDADFIWNKTLNLLTVTGSTNITADLTVDGGTLKVDSTNNWVGINKSPTVALDVSGAATITGDLTVKTNVLKVDTTNERFGFRTASPAYDFDINGVVNLKDAVIHRIGGNPMFARVGAANSYLYAGTTGLSIRNNADSTTFATVDGSGNLGINVTPSAWDSGFQVIENSGGSFWSGSTGAVRVSQNAYYATSLKYKNALAASQYVQTSGQHQWFYDTGTKVAGTACNFVQAMTLTAAGELLIGATSGSGGRLWVQAAGSTENVEFVRLTSSNTFNTLISYVVQAEGYNAGATALKVGKNTSTSRSINAGGTVNASGADYAEYMMKAGDFVLSKGEIAGIDANGKLTNVFANAISFVVKSTDPSYVGNDKWGVDLEGDALETARQLVDRIAFAGQVPVNVTGAKAGDYIVPVVDGTGIKGIAVSKPTFEQYQIAVGKVIAIDADGRARIIVKVA